MQYVYQTNCKVELRPFVAGTYTAILVDGGGNQCQNRSVSRPAELHGNSFGMEPAVRQGTKKDTSDQREAR